MLAGREENQFHAMGSWSYLLPFDGQTVRFVERQGWVGGVRLIMISLPDEDLVIAMVSNDPDTRFDGAWNPDGFVSRVIRASRADR
jgi:CubicO group peptidase (beta-lactamase class C family)